MSLFFYVIAFPSSSQNFPLPFSQGEENAAALAEFDKKYGHTLSSPYELQPKLFKEVIQGMIGVFSGLFRGVQGV